MMASHVPADSSQTSILLAAIQYLKVSYINNPNGCLALLISRNYSLLLELNSSHQEHGKWQAQRQAWQQHCQKNQAGDALNSFSNSLNSI
jgi:uncharacterized protein YfaS (alpha-2-macroglobulin family)